MGSGSNGLLGAADAGWDPNDWLQQFGAFTRFWYFSLSTLSPGVPNVIFCPDVFFYTMFDTEIFLHNRLLATGAVATSTDLLDVATRLFPVVH